MLVKCFLVEKAFWSTIIMVKICNQNQCLTKPFCFEVLAKQDKVVKKGSNVSCSPHRKWEQSLSQRY
jgi:hypothetical protein